MKKMVLSGLVLMFIIFAVVAVFAQEEKIGFGMSPALVSGRDYVPGQLIVGLSNGVHINAVKIAGNFGGTLVKQIPEEAILLHFPSDAQVDAAVKELIRLSEVAFVERNGIKRIPPFVEHGPATKIAPKIGIESVSTDGGTTYQWHHTVIRNTATYTPPASVPAVAVIDTGVDYNHPDLSATSKVILGKNCVGNNADPYDDNGHGTHVAGIIAATGGNGMYGEGVCPNCKIYAVKALGADGSGSYFDIAQCMQDVINKRTANNIKVANMSLGGSKSTLISNKVLAMKNAGIALAASAGNYNTTDTTMAWPGADPNVAFRVMATEENDCRAYFSNYNPVTAPSQFNIAAPGVAILSTYPDAQFKTLSSTSMATPVVAGVAAMVWGAYPADTRNQLIARVLNNAKVINCGFNVATRRVDVRKAVTGVAETAIIGRLLDPFTGNALSPQSTETKAQLKSGVTVLGSDATTKGGFYEIAGLAAGTGRVLKGVKTVGVSNIYLRKGIAITDNTVVGPFTDAFPLKRATGNATVTLDWKSTQPIWPESDCTTGCKLGWEMDMYVKLPDGTWIIPYDLDSSHWSGELLTVPYVINPRDSRDDYQPIETTVIGLSAANGAYEVVVSNTGDGSARIGGSEWGYNPKWTGSSASLQVYNGAAVVSGAAYLNAPDCGSKEYWYAGTLTKSGTSFTWTPSNTCIDTLP